MHGDAGPIQSDQDGLGLHALHPEADQVGEALHGWRPDHLDAVNGEGRLDHPLDLDAGRRLLAGDGALPPLRSECGGSAAEGEEGRQRFEAGPATPLLLPADQERLEARARRTISAPAPGTPPSLWA